MERKLSDGPQRSNLSKREKRRNVGGGSGGEGLKSGKRKRAEGKSAGGEGGEMVVEAGAGSVRSKKGKRKMEAVGIVDLLGSIRKLTSEKEKKEWKKKKKKNRQVRRRREKVGDEENRNGEAGLNEVDHVDARYGCPSSVIFFFIDIHQVGGHLDALMVVAWATTYSLPRFLLLARRLPVKFSGHHERREPNSIVMC